MASHDIYTTPLTGRYSSQEMQKLFSSRSRLSTWRKLWLYLAEAEKELVESEEGKRNGVQLEISDEATTQMKAHLEVEDEDFPKIAEEEKIRRHDVMANVHVFGQKCPAAAGIIHTGATSCYVTDNAELILMRDALELILPKLAKVIDQLKNFALQYKDLPCLAYTHGQAAQPTTVGKRACLWIQDLLLDLRNLQRARSDLRFRGVKGTTGSQASFLAIFKTHEAVERLDELVTKKAGFEFSDPFIITSQTYTRKLDLDVIGALASFGCTCERIGGDLRHLAMFKEIEEPFEKGQIGSSAMAFKRNPMRSERLCALGRNLRNRVAEAAQTYSAQWFERTLDDSAGRRITIPESFLGADACLLLLLNITNGMVVYPAVIKKRLEDELPFMATENIMMRMVEKGHSRQETHEQIRVLSHEAGFQVKQHGLPNDLITRIRSSSFFSPVKDELDSLLDPVDFIGRAPQQVESFVKREVDVALKGYGEVLRGEIIGVVNI